MKDIIIGHQANGRVAVVLLTHVLAVWKTFLLQRITTGTTIVREIILDKEATHKCSITIITKPLFVLTHQLLFVLIHQLHPTLIDAPFKVGTGEGKEILKDLADQ